MVAWSHYDIVVRVGLGEIIFLNNPCLSQLVALNSVASLNA